MWTNLINILVTVVVSDRFHPLKYWLSQCVQYIYGPRLIIFVTRRLFWKDTMLPVRKWKSLRDRKQRARGFLSCSLLLVWKLKFVKLNCSPFEKFVRHWLCFFSLIHLNSVNWLKGEGRWILCIVGLNGRLSKCPAPICKCLLSGKINTCDRSLSENLLFGASGF